MDALWCHKGRQLPSQDHFLSENRNNRTGALFIFQGSADSLKTQIIVITILQNIKPLRQEGTLCGGRPWEEIDDWETTKVEPADRQPHFSPSDKWDESFSSTFVVFTRLWTESRVMFSNQERLRMLLGGQGQQLGENKGHTVPPSGLRYNCSCMFNMRQWCFMPVTEAALFTCWGKAN